MVILEYLLDIEIEQRFHTIAYTNLLFDFNVKCTEIAPQFCQTTCERFSIYRVCGFAKRWFAGTCSTLQKRKNKTNPKKVEVFLSFKDKDAFRFARFENRLKTFSIFFNIGQR